MSSRTKQKEALGRGIRALLNNIEDESGEQSGDGAGREGHPGGVVLIRLGDVEVNPFQPRADFDEDSLQDLASSIEVHGVIQPITVRRTGDKFQLIAGERRLRASKLAGKEQIPAYVRDANDQESLEIALIENIQREDLNPIEIGMNYQRLLDECGISHDELGSRLGKKRSTVTNYLRLLKLPPDIQLALKAGEISMGHARALIPIDKVDEQLSLFKDIIRKGLSVRQVEAESRSLSSARKQRKTAAPASDDVPPEYRDVQNRLADYLSTRVKLKANKSGKGEIVISYFSDLDLDRLFELITDK